MLVCDFKYKYTFCIKPNFIHRSSKKCVCPPTLSSQFLVLGSYYKESQHTVNFVWRTQISLSYVYCLLPSQRFPLHNNYRYISTNIKIQLPWNHLPWNCESMLLNVSSTISFFHPHDDNH